MATIESCRVWYGKTKSDRSSAGGYHPGPVSLDAEYGRSTGKGDFNHCATDSVTQHSCHSLNTISVNLRIRHIGNTPRIDARIYLPESKKLISGPEGEVGADL